MRECAQRFDPRQNMRQDTFEVFHYKDPRPSTVDVHHHDFYEVYFLLGDDVEYWVDGRVIRMTAGDLLLINPMELHRPVLAGETWNYERIVLWINREYLKSFHTGQEDLSSCFDTGLPNHTHIIRPSPSERSSLTTCLADLVRESYNREYGSSLYAQGLFLQFMVQLNRMAHCTRVQEDTQQVSILVQDVLHYISENLGQPLSLESIAASFFVSKYYLSHTFRQEVGVSVYRYIMLRRLMLARQLLLSGETAGRACRSCGFSDYTSFYRAFKSEYGISPRVFTSEND